MKTTLFILLLTIMTTQVFAESATFEPFDDFNNRSTLNLELLKDLPKVVDLKNIMTSVKDQGNRGTCSFFASMGLIESAIKQRMHVDVNLSEEYLSYLKNVDDRQNYEDGTLEKNLFIAFYRDAAFVLERDWPYQPSWFGEKAPCKEFKTVNANAPKVCFTHNRPPQDVLDKKIPADGFDFDSKMAKSTNQYLSLLAAQKPISLTVTYTEEGWNSNGEVQYTEEMRNNCINNKAACGNHIIILTGYDIDKKVFFFKNSFGKGWGKEGYGTMPFDMIDRHTYQSIVTVEMKEDIKLPSDYDKEYLSFNKFDIFPGEQADGAITLESSGAVDNVGFSALSLISTIVTSNDDNGAVLQLSSEDAKLHKNTFVKDTYYIFADVKQSTVEWNAGSDVKLKLSKEALLLDTILKGSDLYARTSLYAFTDEGYKVLKRYYTPIRSKK
jgi:hypothetical protein